LEYLGLENGWYKVKLNGQVGFVYANYAKLEETVKHNNGTGTHAEKKATVIAKGGLLIREQASTSSGRLGILSNGTNIIILESVNGWYKVSVNGKIGYVFGKYVKVEETIQQNNSTNTQTEKSVTVNARSGLILRNQATTKSGKLSVLRNGTKVKVLESVNGWYKIEYDGKIGYIFAEYTK
jgi:uncharacterized protein YgiM (DUF1202 family)